jgi:ankyrin repeat protein
MDGDALSGLGGQPAVVRLLSEKGADINAEDKYGNTALDLATDEEHEEVMQLLLTSTLPPY